MKGHFARPSHTWALGLPGCLCIPKSQYNGGLRILVQQIRQEVEQEIYIVSECQIIHPPTTVGQFESERSISVLYIFLNATISH
jgi:hypothetical protein